MNRLPVRQGPQALLARDKSSLKHHYVLKVLILDS